jgi:hypothetical protein
LKKLKFRRAPLSIRMLASNPTGLQPIIAASINIPPTPQNGSRKIDPGFARARLTIHRAIFGGIVEG